MSIPYQSFSLQAGQNIELPITVVDAAGAAVDLTGASGRFVMARNTSATPIIDSDTATATLTVTDAVNGLITVEVDDTDLTGLEGDYYYECKVTDSSTNESVIARGWISFQPTIT